MFENLEIIYSDNDIIAINKPPGVSVHGGPNVTGQTLVDFLLEKFPEIAGVGDDPALRPAHKSGEARSFFENERPGIVHRLDKDTSGVMVVARNMECFLALKDLFQKRLVEKTYWAVCCGVFKEKKGLINYPIGRLVSNPLKRGAGAGRSKIRGARDAVTEYKVLRTFAVGSKINFSLVELRPKTGRMHQLRVHMSAIHHPVACDRVYGGKNVCCIDGASRQLLHARSLSFSFPAGRKLHFEADPPHDFSNAISKFE